MKGFLAGVVVTAPITILLLYVVMSGRTNTVMRIERGQIRQQIAEEKFDSDFDQAWNSMSVSDKEMKERELARQERLARLREKERQFDEQFNRRFEQSQEDVEDLREILSSQDDQTERL